MATETARCFKTRSIEFVCPWILSCHGRITKRATKSFWAHTSFIIHFSRTSRIRSRGCIGDCQVIGLLVNTIHSYDPQMTGSGDAYYLLQFAVLTCLGRWRGKCRKGLDVAECTLRLVHVGSAGAVFACIRRRITTDCVKLFLSFITRMSKRMTILVQNRVR